MLIASFGKSSFSVPRPPVLVLLRIRRPAAIAWLIITVVVDAIKRESKRLFPHICEKVFKAISPSIAHSDAATCVAREAFVFRVVAASFHIRPRSKRSGPSASSVAMCSACFANAFKLETTT